MNSVLTIARDRSPANVPAQGDAFPADLVGADIAVLLRGSDVIGAYNISKAADIQLAKNLAVELGPDNIRVNAICPGLIETGMTRMIFDRADERGTRSKIGQLNPLLRYGEPEEIASVALFLASSAASYVNGQAVAVCGGLSSSHPVSRRGRLQVSA